MQPVFLLLRLLYSAVIVALTPLLMLYLLLRSRKDPAYRQRFAERFAFSLPATSAKDGIVLHTVSVGEFNAAKPLIKQLLLQYPHLPLTITCTTPTASAAIQKLQAEQQQLGRTLEHCYLPFDYPVLMHRWLKWMQPQLLLILETELWPNLVANCKALSIPTLVVNARLSARSAKGYRRFSALTQPMLQNISQILTQDKASARRFLALGAKDVQVAGNLKFELDVPKTSTQLAHSLKPLLQGRMVWVAGSTHAGEDELLIQAYLQLKVQFPQLLLVLVPIALVGTRGIARSLGRMAQNSERLRAMDFSAEPTEEHSYLYEINALGEAQTVMHRSVKERTAALELAQAKLSRIVETGIELGRQQDRAALLHSALFGAREIAHCQAATLFLKTERNTLRFALRTSDDPLPATELALYDINGHPDHRYVATHVVLTGETVVIDDIYSETRFDVSGTKRFSESSSMRVVSTLNVPLKAREGHVLGLFQLMNALDPDTIVHANAHHMAVAIEGLDAAIARIEAAGSGPPTAFRRV